MDIPNALPGYYPGSAPEKTDKTERKNSLAVRIVPVGQEVFGFFFNQSVLFQPYFFSVR